MSNNKNSWRNEIKLSQPKKRIVEVLCGCCLIPMNISLWGVFEWWLPRYKEWVGIGDYPAPHRNQSHECQNCGKLWLSSDFLELIADTDEKVTFQFVEKVK